MADRDQEARASEHNPAGEPDETASELDPAALWAMLQGARVERDQHKESAEQYLSMLQRVQADFLNYKRRVEAEHEGRAESVRAETIRAFLPIVDDIERALEHVPADLRDESWVQGFELIARNLTTAFERLGLQRVGAVGDLFDPRLHEAVGYEEHPSQPEGHIAAVYRSGYQLGERVVRPAQVVVARASDRQDPGSRGWRPHQARKRHGNGGVDQVDLHDPRHIERS